jgi:phospholipase/carboxylesterase
MHTKLSFLEQLADPAASQPWLLVLMHGVGSNEQDLFGLAPQLPRNFHIISLRAPHTLAPGAYAWFEFAVLADGTRRINAEQEASSRDIIAANVALHAQRLGVPAPRVVVGGFSQGGIMGLGLLLTQPALAHAALVMHSRLLPEVEGLIAAPEAFNGKQLWVSHGLQDTMIPLAAARAIKERVSSLPLDLRYAEFPGGHEIRPAELDAMIGWLTEISA